MRAVSRSSAYVTRAFDFLFQEFDPNTNSPFPFPGIVNIRITPVLNCEEAHAVLLKDHSLKNI